MTRLKGGKIQEQGGGGGSRAIKTGKEQREQHASRILGGVQDLWIYLSAWNISNSHGRS